MVKMKTALSPYIALPATRPRPTKQYSEVAGVLCVIAALLIPSCCIGVPQLLAQFGLLSQGLGCLLWLERLRPLFVSVALATLTYQVWAAFKGSSGTRRRSAKAMLAASVISNVLVLGVLIFTEFRYQ